MFIHLSKYKKFTNIYQPSLNKVLVMQSYFLFHFPDKYIYIYIFMKRKRLGDKLKLK